MIGAGAAVADTPQKPLWEFGLGVGALAFADYRGADTSHIYPLPVPYFLYRGQFLRADRDGVRGLLLDRTVAEINISVGATTPVRSGDTLARRGMPDLKPTVEIGPSLDLHLWKSVDRQVRLDLRLPARAAVTVESAPRSIGWFVAPQFTIDVLDVGRHAGWDLGLLAGPLFADQRYHQYFYGVAPEYATAGRPAYQAHGGYAGTQVLMSLSKRFPDFWVGAFVRYDALGGATFASSPLVRTTSYWATGVGIAWMIGKSSRMVDAIDVRQ
ncbi:MAG TPA: MipA/OmpV family protein [Steroidobacteraceae bacterium]|nr:MipA/OmpV family protein [Steroidobacteraceae bacterium]